MSLLHLLICRCCTAPCLGGMIDHVSRRGSWLSQVSCQCSPLEFHSLANTTTSLRTCGQNLLLFWTKCSFPKGKQIGLWNSLSLLCHIAPSNALLWDFSKVSHAMLADCNIGFSVVWRSLNYKDFLVLLYWSGQI